MSTTELIVLTIVFSLLSISLIFVKKWIESRYKTTWSANGDAPKKIYDASFLGTTTQLGGFKRKGLGNDLRVYYEGTVILGFPVELKKCYAMRLASSSATYKAPNMEFSYKYSIHGSQPMDSLEKLYLWIRPLILWGAALSILGLFCHLVIL